MNTTVRDTYLKLKTCLIRNRRIVVTVVFVAQVIIANYCAFILRFDGILTRDYFHKFLGCLPVLIVIRLAFYLKAGLHKGLWRYASISDMIKIANSATI